MTPSKANQRWARWTFVAILVVGVIVMTSMYRSSVMHPVAPPTAEDLTERQKQLISAQQEMSKWLLGLASTALAGVVGLRLRHPHQQSLVDIAPMSAYALLLLSLYAGFLSYQSAFEFLQRGPLSYLYGDALRAPVVLQFWTLMGALVLLASWLLQNRRSALAILLIPILGGLPSAHAQSLNKDQCVREWYADRLHAPEANPHDAASVLEHLSHLKSAKPFGQCVDINSVLDSLRFASGRADQGDTVAGFGTYLRSLDDELTHPQLAMSEVVHNILDLMQPWSPDAAVLSVRSAHGICQILLDGLEVGMTNWDIRLTPSTDMHRLRVVRNGKLLYKSNQLSFKAGQSMLIDVDHLP